MNKDGAFIIAELSANHNNDFELACRTLEAISMSGADAVKVQTYKPSSLSLDVDNEHFGKKTSGPWKGIRPWDLYQKACMPYDWTPKLKKMAEDLGLVFFSSPFDFEAVDFLESLNVPLYKIASFEINDIPLIKKVASTNKPIIISTGVATIEDIHLAIHTCFDVGNTDVTLLKCTSEYPALVSDANLLTMLDMKSRFNVKVGVSDHTMGYIVPVAAVALGATVIEKHFILDRNLGGPDSFFSMEPQEFKDMVKVVRCAESSLGMVSYAVSEKDLLRRRSLFAIKDIEKGEEFSSDNVKSLRPGIGLAPLHLPLVLNSKASRRLSKGEALKLDHLSKL